MRHGEIFKAIRIQKGFSQDKLVDGICARSTLATFETKGSHLSVELCSKLLDRMNTSPDTYFSLLSEDYDSKRKSLDELRRLMNTNMVSEISHQRTLFYSAYLSTQDIYWFHLHFIALEYLEKLNDSFSYDYFKKIYADDISILKHYLFKVTVWDKFEFELFSDALWYFDLDMILLINKRIESFLNLQPHDNILIFGSYLINFGFYCLEYGHYSLLKKNKQKIFKFATCETIHWKILSSFQLAIAEELVAMKRTDDAIIEKIIEPYTLLAEDIYFDKLRNYRKLLHKAHLLV